MVVLGKCVFTQVTVIFLREVYKWECMKSMESITAENLLVGTKQATRAVEKGEALKAYVANGVVPSMRNAFVKLCKKNNVPIEVVKSMSELGKMCGVNVKTSFAVVVK